MFQDSKVQAKIGMILGGMPIAEELEKEANKGRMAGKIIGGITGLGAVGGVAYGVGHEFGEDEGEARGVDYGRSAQLKQDKQRFGAASKKIYEYGRAQQKRQDMNQFKSLITSPRFSNAMVERSRRIQAQGNPNRAIGIPTTKTASTNDMAEAVYEGWRLGNISIEEMQKLPSSDLAKVASVVVQKINSGDKSADMLWRIMND